MLNRTTVSIEENLHKLLKLKAIETKKNISELLNEILANAFKEDAQDLKVFDAREKEESISFESFLKDLETNGKL